MLKIHDIKPIVQIPDYSIYLYYGLILVAVLFGLFLVYLVYNFFKNKPISKQKEYFDILQNIDFSDVKNSAYTISRYGKLLAEDDRQKMLMDELYNSLEEFKYKKIVANSFSNDIKIKYDRFMESLDVK